MELKSKTIKSKKNGKEYTAYYIAIGDYVTPIFFPSKVELVYIKGQLGLR